LLRGVNSTVASACSVLLLLAMIPCLFALSGIDEEGLIDRGLDARIRSIEGALRGLPEGSYKLFVLFGVPDGRILNLIFRARASLIQCG
jgi:hypothetical protein